MSEHTPGPMEKELRRTLPAPHCAECRVEKERIIGMAREQDAIRAEMLAALYGAVHIGSVLRQLCRDSGTRLHERDEERIDAIESAIARARGESVTA